MDECHWAVMSTMPMGEEDAETSTNCVAYYDSMFTFLSANTQSTLMNLLQPKSFQLQVNLMAVSKLSGSIDCGLYAIAIATALAFGQNPCLHVYHQEDMRSHLQECLVNRKMSPFPTKNKRRVKNKRKGYNIHVPRL